MLPSYDGFSYDGREVLKALFDKITRRGVQDPLAYDMTQDIGRSVKKIHRKFSSAVLSRGGSNPHDSILSDLAFIASMPHAEHLFPGISLAKPFLKSIKKDGQHIYSPWPARRNIYLMDDFNQIAMPASLRLRSLDEDTSETCSGEALAYAANNGFPAIDEKQYVPTMGAEDFIAFEHSDIFASSDDTTAFPFVTLHSQETWTPTLLRKIGIQESDLDINFDGRIQCHFEVAGARVLNENGFMRSLVTAYPKNKLAHAIMAMILGRIDDRPTPNAPLRVCFFIEHCVETGDTYDYWLAYEATDITCPSIASILNSSNDSRYNEELEEFLFEMADIFFYPIDEFAQLSIHLPQYFQMQVERAKTNKSKPGSDGVIGTTTKANTADEGVFITEKSANPQPKGYKVVRAIKPSVCLSLPEGNEGDAGGSRTTRAEPETQVAVDGFWRTLQPSSVGRGPMGQPVLGKTWVRAHTRYNDKPVPTEPKSRVKQPLSKFTREN